MDQKTYFVIPVCVAMVTIVRMEKLLISDCFRGYHSACFCSCTVLCQCLYFYIVIDKVNFFFSQICGGLVLDMCNNTYLSEMLKVWNFVCQNGEQ